MSSELSTSTLVDNVSDEIRRMILDGEIEPGEFLPTRKELAADFGVGLSTIQEAIQALSAVGMLASRPGKGTWVRKDALDGLVHPETVRKRLGELNADKVYEARRVIEIALTEMAARRATPDDIQTIWAALDRMEDTIEDDQAFIAADLDFHLAVARAGNNELLEQFYHLSRRLVVQVIAGVTHLPGVKRDSIPYQRAIVQAIEAGDPERARKAAEEHMDYAEGLLTAWESVQSGDSQGRR